MSIRNGKSKQNSSVMSHDPLAEVDTTEMEATETPMDGGHKETPSAAPTEEPVFVMENQDQAKSASNPVTKNQVFDLGDCLTVMDVGEIYPKMVGLCDTGGRIEINGAEIDQIDGAGVQLLAALTREAAQLQVEIGWIGVSESMKEATATMGLCSALHLPDYAE